jgi:hypothetical protein
LALEQGKQEPFIAEALVAPSEEKLAHIPAERIPADSALAKFPGKYL